MTAETTKVSTSILWTPPLKTRQDALEYLEGDFAAWCLVAGDLVSAGAHVPAMLAFDLAQIAGALAEFLRGPSRGPLSFLDESHMHLGDLARSIDELDEKTERGVEFTTVGGLRGDVSPYTKPLLAVALARGVQSQRDESEDRWNAEMERRERRICSVMAATGC